MAERQVNEGMARLVNEGPPAVRDRVRFLNCSAHFLREEETGTQHFVLDLQHAGNMQGT
jgi:hypothetical protein